ncbi:MAG: hypothetical protein R3F60_10045 [bacterium]
MPADVVVARLAASPRWAHKVGVRWVFDGAPNVDVVPVEAGDESPLMVDGWSLSRVGMGSVISMAVPLVGAPRDIRLAPIPSIVLMKMVAFLDRPQAREKDRGDVRWIVERYARDTDRVVDFWQARVELDLGLDEAGAWLLGRDMAAGMSTLAVDRVRAFVEQMTGADRLLDDRDPLVRLLPCLWEGLSEALRG